MKKKSFLICHPGALGDFILCWPALAGLRKKFPDHEFVGIGRYPYLQMARKWQLLDTLHDIEARYLLHFFSGKKLPLELAEPDGAVLWLADSAEMVKILQMKATLPVLSLNPKPSIQYHISQYYLQQVQKSFSIQIPEVTIGNQFLLHRSNPEWILIHPGSGSPHKNFSPGFYRSLLEFFSAEGFPKTAIVLGAVEIDAGLQNAFPNSTTFTPANLDELLELLGNCSLYIGNDSGVSHLAGILGVPTIAFYSRTDPAVWGVMGKEVYLISAESENQAYDSFKKVITNHHFLDLK